MLPTCPGYLVERRLASVAGNDIWAARDVASGDRVALQVIEQTSLGKSGALAPIAHISLADLTESVSVWNSVGHPHIAWVREVVVGDQQLIVVLNAADGGQVSDLLPLVPLAPGDVVTALAPIAQALDAAHAHNLVHGNLTAEHVLLDRTGRPVLLPNWLPATVTAADDVARLYALAAHMLGEPPDPGTARRAARARASSAADLATALFAMAPAQPLGLTAAGKRGRLREFDQPTSVAGAPSPASTGRRRRALFEVTGDVPIIGDHVPTRAIALTSDPVQVTPAAITAKATPEPVGLDVSIPSSGVGLGSKPNAERQSATGAVNDEQRSPDGQETNGSDTDVRASTGQLVVQRRVVRPGSPPEKSLWGRIRAHGAALTAPRERGALGSKRRLALLVVPLLIAAAVLAWAVGRDDPATATSAIPTDPATVCGGRSPAPEKAPTEPKDWATVVQVLYELRAEAFVNVDTVALCNVYAAGSAGLAEDLRRVGAYAASDVHPAEVPFEIVKVVRDGRSGAAVEVTITDSLAPYDLVDDEGIVIERKDGLAERTWSATLVPSHDGRTWVFN